MTCDLCQRSEAAEARKLCVTCGEAIQRLIYIRDRAPRVIAYVDAKDRYAYTASGKRA